MAKAIMIQGTMSGVGKSLLTAALCRIFYQDGIRVCPFKSQNMALNSFVTADGLEMGRAQVLQAQAAGLEPDVRMNPILLKPSSDTGSQVILDGVVYGQYSARDYFRLKKKLFPRVLADYKSLEQEFDLIVIEGAGSAAEINLKEDDIVNMGLAKAVHAPVVLVGNIDPGGVFAQLYGTIALLEEEERNLVKGMVINQFRGELSLLLPGLEKLEALTNLPVLGVIPWMPLSLDEEDSMAAELSVRSHEKRLDVAVIRFPHISNFTDFAPLNAHPMLGVRYVSDPGQWLRQGRKAESERDEPDFLILPGTKNTIADLRWLNENGLVEKIRRYAKKGGRILGICGGYQMLGEMLYDPSGTEDGRTASMKGIGLLPVRTTFTSEKVRTRVKGTLLADGLSNCEVDGYEIHMGESKGDGPSFCSLSDGREDGCVAGNVWGTYLHGLFDTGEAVEALVRLLCHEKGISPDSDQEQRIPVKSRRQMQEEQLDLLADTVRRHLSMEKLKQMIEAGVSE